MSELFKELMKPDPVDQEMAQRQRHRNYLIDVERQKFLSDPSVAEKILSHIAHQSLPEQKAAKISPNATLDRIERAIPSDDLRKGIATQVLTNYTNILRESPGVHPTEAIAKAYMRKLSDLNKDNALYENMFEREAGFGGSAPVNVPGYEQYKTARMAQHEKETPVIGNLLHGLLGGATIQGIAEGLSKTGLWKNAATKIAGPLLSKIPHPAARIAGVALMAIPAMIGEDILTYPLRKTQWSAAHPLATAGLQLATGVGVYEGLERGLRKGIASYADKTKLFEKAGLDVTNDPSIKNMSEYLSVRGDLFKKELDLEKSIEKNKSFWEGIPEVGAGEAVTGVATPRAWETLVDASLYGSKGKVVDKSLQEADNRFIADLVSKGVDPEEAVKRVKNFAGLREYSIGETARLAEGTVATKARADEFGKLFTERMSKTPEADPMLVAKQVREEQDLVSSLFEIDREKILGKRPINDTGILAKTKSALTSKIGEQIDELEKQTRLYIESGVPGVKSADELSHQLAFGKIDDTQAISALDALETAKRRGLLTESEKLERTGPILDDIRATKPGLLSDQRVMSHEWDAIVNHFNTAKTPDPRVVDRAKELLDNPTFQRMMVEQDVRQVDRLSKILYGDLDETKRMMQMDVAAGMSPDQIFAKYGSLGKYAAVGAIAASVGLIPPLSTPSEASIRIDPLAKYVGEKLSKPEMMQKIWDMGLHSPISSKYQIEKFQNSLNFVPDLSNIARQHKLNPILNFVLTPGAKGQFYFKTGLSPEPILASKTIAAHNNTQEMLNVATNILENIPEQTKEIQEFMRPMLGYQEMLAQYGALREQRGVFDKILSGKYKSADSADVSSLSRRIKSGKLDEEDVAMIDEFTKKRDVIDTELEKFKEPLAAYKADWDSRARVLAEKYPTSRVFFASEGVGMGAADPWVAKYLTHEEGLAAARIRRMMEQQKERSVEAGMDVIDSKNYMHYAFHPESDLSKLDEIVKNVSLDKGAGIQMSKYHTRSFDALPLMPDAHYALRRYIPDSNMRIEMADFWRDWKPFMEKAKRAGYDGVADHLERLSRAFSPADQSGGLNKWANRYQLFEVARLLSLSPSVGFKHGMKVMANIALGGTSTLKNIPESAVAVKDLNISSLMREQPPNLRSDLLKAFIGGKNMYAIASDLVPYQAPLSKIDIGLGKFAEHTNQIINTVEKFDRGLSMLSAIEMAAKRGMTPGQAAYSVYDTILKANFMSGIHNPSWLRDPKVRALLLFQGTPFKIWEQRLITAYKGGKAISEATKQLYNQMKRDIKEGEVKMKYGIIKDAFTAARDVNGNSYSGQLMRMLLTLGTVGIGGKELLGVSFMDQILHPPFLKIKEQSASLATNPIMGAAFGTLMSKDDDTNAFIEFLGKWLPNWGAPAIVNKFDRLTKKDIPEIYRDNKLQYFFGVPSWTAED